MRVTLSWWRLAAALLAVLLLLGLPRERVNAQGSDGLAVRSITNIAEATWDADGTRRRVSRNPVRFDVNALSIDPPIIRVFRRSTDRGSELVYRPPNCGVTTGPVQLNRKAATASLAPGSNAVSVLNTAIVQPTDHLRGGEPLYFEISAASANRDPGTIEGLTVVLTSIDGDRETVTVFETTFDSGVFSGVINTFRIPPTLVQEDCRLSVGQNSRITVAAMRPGSDSVLVQADIGVLIDPFGVVFDSETGEPVDGARVTLVDAATGTPAVVFAEDGITPWPSTVTSGTAVIDGAGRSVPMGAGEFWFPLTSEGRFRLVIEPPAPFTAPSAAPPELLARINRLDGRPYVIREGSFGDAFVLDDPVLFEVDIPVDRPSIDLAVTKTASRTNAAPGDAIFYTVTVRNADPARIKRAVTLTDTPSRWLRLRADTIRINGVAAPQAVTVSPDGRVLSVALGDLAAGASARVTYAMTVRPDAPPGRALNEAAARDALGRRSRASAAVDLVHDGIADRMTIIGRVTAGACSLDETERTGLGGLLTGMAPTAARWVVEGEDGLARIELAPTMVSGSLRLAFAFDDGNITRRQELEAWIEPGDVEWTVVGLAEGTLGARSVADNMERAGQFDSDLGDDARVALYARGRVLEKYLLTVAYDSAKQREDQRVLGAIDPQAYYTVFGDASARRFDAASREKLYVRIETSTFHALYGDFQTAFNQTRLANYNRTATGVKGEARVGQVKAQGFAARIASRFRRQEIQGQGISGPYSLASRRLLANSERVSIEVRDRFRPELIVSTRELARFADYDIDALSGTISFAAPVLSRDDNLNPQCIVIEFEVDGAGEAEWNAGARADWSSADGAICIGASAISDAGLAGPREQAQRTDLGAADLIARVGENTEIRAEIGVSRREGSSATGWLVEAQHQTGNIDLLAYAREIEGDYGIGQQNAAERGRRKAGVDGRVLLSQELSLVGSLWQDEALGDATRRRAAQGQMVLVRQRTNLRLGAVHFDDRLADGTRAASTVLEAGATQRLFDNRLELSAGTAIALDQAESLDLPARHRLGVRYAVTQDVRLVGTYELADGANLNARQLRGGIEVSPWQGGQVVTTLGEETIGENGNRSFAAFGLSQTQALSPSLTIDATIDGNRTLKGNPGTGGVINPAQPPASGGQIAGGLLFEDFTAVTFGAAWRKDRWSVVARGEMRDGETGDRKGLTFGAIRQLGEGSLVGSGATWTLSEAAGGAKAEILDASIAFARRPSASPLAVLGRLEYRSDRITGGVAGEIGGAGGVGSGAGRTALVVDGNATSRRLVASLSSNFSPRGQAEGAEVRRHEIALFLGARHNFDQFEGTAFSGTSVLVGADARIGIGERFEVGASATVRSNLTDKATSFAYGPTLGVVPAKGMLVMLGYNIEGFRDGDFGPARNSSKGVFAAVRMSFDADSLGFLGLGR